MCMLLKDANAVLKIAKRRKVVWKVLRDDLKGGWSGPYMNNFKYELNKSYESELGLCESYLGYSNIKEGLHTYKPYSKSAGLRGLNLLTYNIIVKAYIPVGAEYYYDSMNQEYVSNRLELTDKIIKQE